MKRLFLILIAVLLVSTAAADYDIRYTIPGADSLWVVLTDTTTFIGSSIDTTVTVAQYISGNFQPIEITIWRGTTPTTFNYWYYSGVGQSTGNGPHVFTVAALDTAAISAIAGVQISLFSLDTVLYQILTTGVGGWVTNNAFLYDSFLVWASKPGYVFSMDDSLFITGSDDTVTIEGYANPAPAAGAGVDFVAAYIDLGTGQIDSVTGDMVPREKIEVILVLNAELGAHIDSSWALVPTEYSKRPDASGRVTFLVPANTVISPPGSSYTLFYKLGRRTSAMSEIRKFTLDTIPDPINILNTTQVP